MTWLSQSPDLNPVENIWKTLKKQIRERRPKIVNELQTFAKEEWAKTPFKNCQTLVEHTKPDCQSWLSIKEIQQSIKCLKC